MTVRDGALTRRPMWLAALFVGVFALGAVAFVGGERLVDNRAAASAWLECDATEVTFGDALSCTVSTTDEVVLDWGDGAIGEGGGDHTHRPAAIGLTTVRVLHDDEVLASHAVDIAPDVRIDCEHGLPLPVYELADGPSPSGEPYDYVYLAADGTKVFPGEADYPANLGEILAHERAVVEHAPIVGLCRSESAAVDALGGSVVWTVESPWYEPYTTKSRNITPGTPAHWDGVQPIDVTLTVEVDGYEASERIGVYFGGCG